MFPERVSRLIIDGVVNLEDWYNKFSEYKSFIDTDKVFAGFTEECFNAKERCALNSINNASFATAADLLGYINGFLQRLEEEPIPVYLNNTHYGAVTRKAVVVDGILPAMYSPSTSWPVLARILAELFNGNATPAFLQYSSSWFASIYTDDTNRVVSKNDNWKTGSKAPFRGIKELLNYTLSQEAVSTLVSKYFGSAAFDLAAWPIPTTHSFHPRYYPKHPRFKTATPILILSAEFDPVCPLSSARKALDSFEGSGLVVQKSYGHCAVSMPSLCTAKHIRQYLYKGILPVRDSL
jgi:pimeloyl-ACP methyl ester carboxylesterase